MPAFGPCRVARRVRFRLDVAVRGLNGGWEPGAGASSSVGRPRGPRGRHGVDDARATLPSRVHYTPRRADPAIAALLPADAVPAGEGWRFVLPTEGIEPSLGRLIAAGHGIAGLVIERPSLHEAFVRIVGEAAASGAVPVEQAA